MNLPNALRQYFVTLLTSLRRMRWHLIRSRAVLLMLVALLNSAQGIFCNLHDVSHMSRGATADHLVLDYSHQHASSPNEQTDPSDPLDIESHCLHISCVHSPAFAASLVAHEFMRALSTAPSTGAQLHGPVPPLGANFRPPITA